MGLRHKFVSAVADGGNSALVQPTNWNADHSLTGFPGIVCGRLTLTSQYPVPVDDATAATTVYFAPYLGNQISLYNGSTSQWDIINYVQASLSLSGFTANLPYDIFGYNSSGTLVLEAAVWTNSSTRATALADEGGALVKSADHTRLLLGTIRITGTTGQCEDSEHKRFVANIYNRRMRRLRAVESTNSWTYSTASYRQANAAATNQVEIVTSLSESVLALDLLVLGLNSTTGQGIKVAIGEDSTTTQAAELLFTFGEALTTAYQLSCVLRKTPTAGYHYYTWEELGSGSGTTTWYGDNGGNMQSGLSGWIDS